MSPFVTQKSYEGQIDEHFNIQANSVYIPDHVLSSAVSVDQQTKTRVSLSAQTDFIFREIRYKPYESLGFFIQKMTKELTDATDKGKQNARNLEELSQMVSRIKNLNIPLAKPLLDLHLNLSYSIKQTNKQLDWEQYFVIERRILWRDWDKPTEVLRRIET